MSHCDTLPCVASSPTYRINGFTLKRKVPHLTEANKKLVNGITYDLQFCLVVFA